MRAVSAGAVLSNKLWWWEGLVDASECWGSRLNKSFGGSLAGAVKCDTVFCTQVQAIPNALADNRETNLRADNYERYTAFVLHMRRYLRDVCEGARSTCKSVCGSMPDGDIPSITFSGRVHRGAAGGYKRFSQFAKSVSVDDFPTHQGCPSNGFSWDELFKKSQQAYEADLCSDKLSHVGKDPDGKTYIAFCTQRYLGLDNDGSQVLTAQAFKANIKHFSSRSYLFGSFRCSHEILGSKHALPFNSFGRSLSTSTEKQFDEDVAEQQSQQQSSVPSQQQNLLGGQQTSLGGQQVSLEVPDSKPAGGPSWPNPDNAASYVLMSNIYADGDRWDEVKRINEMRLKARAWKKPGKAYVEIQAKVHEFIVGDRTHQDSTNIYEKLRKIKRHMGHIGYVPYVDLVLENRSYYDPYKPR